MRSVTQAEIAAFASPYLAGGYKTDELRLDRADIADGRIEGVYSVPSRFLPPDGTFHFTLLLGFIAVAQLAIVYGHIDNALPTKRSEVLLRHLDLRCRRLITTTSDIPVELVLTQRRSIGGAHYYSGVIDIADGAFSGRGAFVFPVGSEPAGAPSV